LIDPATEDQSSKMDAGYENASSGSKKITSFDTISIPFSLAKVLNEHEFQNTIAHRIILYSYFGDFVITHHLHSKLTDNAMLFKTEPLSLT